MLTQSRKGQDIHDHQRHSPFGLDGLNRVAVECGAVLDEIVDKVSVVLQMSHSISTASDEQARGISEINKAVTQLDQMTQQNAAVSEEAASAAEQLSSQAESMQGIVQTLIHTIKGGVTSFKAEQSLARPQARPSQRAQPAKTKGPSNSNVVRFSSRKPLNAQANKPSSFRMVSGGDSVPSEDDPRFKDI